MDRENTTSTDSGQSPPLLSGRRGEWAVFVFLAVIIWPIISVAVVGGYGFAVWMYQLVAGPPGPPGG